MGDRWCKFLKRFHPEGIPWPGSVLYNALSSTSIFLRHYELVAHDIAHYGTARYLLDIGTGPGHLLLALRKRLPEAELIGIDISPAMMAQAQRHVKTHGRATHIELQIAGANALPFADGVFDRVVSTGSLHHWNDPLSSLSEAYRVLRVGGYALMYDLVRSMPKGVCVEARARFGRFRFALLWLHSFEEPFLNVEEMEALGRRTDFTVEGTKFTGVFCCLVLRKVVDLETRARGMVERAESRDPDTIRPRLPADVEALHVDASRAQSSLGMDDR